MALILPKKRTHGLDLMVLSLPANRSLIKKDASVFNEGDVVYGIFRKHQAEFFKFSDLEYASSSCVPPPWHEAYPIGIAWNDSNESCLHVDVNIPDFIRDMLPEMEILT